MPDFRKLLVANRGEIAIRIFRSAHELGIRTVAIYSHEDRFGMHRLKADEAYQVGTAGEPIRSYLNVDQIVALAREKEVDAIHPGYGFLSENAGFARACAAAGIAFVGPRPELLELAKANGGRIIVPTGGLLGLDAVAAAAEGKINSVKMTTRKPPNGLAGAPHLVKNNISVEGLNEAKLVFSGTARDAAAGFPANVNVVAALAMAGIGPDKTMIDIYADPTKTRNCHVIEVDADSASFTLSIENIPSENPKTGRIVALSVIATLRKLAAPLRVGT
jgi:hypothetical protein